jgi:hypothetical protein
MIENFIETNESIVFGDKGFISLKLNHFRDLVSRKNIKLRIWLKFYSIEADEEGIVLDVFLSLDDREMDSLKAENYIDSIALFGIKKIIKEHHVGIDHTIDITEFVSEKNIKHLNNCFINISISNRKELKENNKVTIDKISILKEIII